MTLEAGRMLLHYRVVEKIGEGGMGEVWRAVDTTLDRDVAIKVLPPAFVADAERLARFEREARTLATLSHPSIASVHGLHGERDARFIVMELVPGEDLSQRLERGPIEVREALGIARRIAEALEAAHERGVVHRDLKPANVVVKDDGTVKVLDFGLAKILETDVLESGSQRLSMSPTMTSAGTLVGTILGTAGYMSPEQVRGRTIDRRADLWAFGCVLYEMLAGRRAFGGETVSDTLAAILKEEPDWSALPDDTPAPVRRLLRRCLTRDVAARQAGAADARILIEDVLAGRYDDEAGAAGPARRGGGGRLPWLVAGAAVVAALGLAWAAFGRPVPEASSARLSIAFPEGAFLVQGIGGRVGSLALSPRGDRLAYLGLDEAGTKTCLYVRSMDSFEPTLLAGTDGASYPVFSPDGEWIAYFDDAHLVKIPAVGGASVPLADVSSPRGISWARSDRILYVPDTTGGVWSVSSEGGEPRQVTRPDEAEGVVSHRYPYPLPGGTHVLVTAKTSTLASFDDAWIVAVSLESGESRVVLRGGTQAKYHDGHLVYGRDGRLFAVPFDPGGLETEGTPFPVLDGVATSPAWGIVQFDVAEDGTIAFVPGIGSDGRDVLATADLAGNVEPLVTQRLSYSFLSLAPDGRRALVSVRRANDEIWIVDLERGSLSPFVSMAGNEDGGVWSRGGDRIVFRSDRANSYDLYVMDAEGSEGGHLLLDDDASKLPTDLSVDDALVFFHAIAPETGLDLWYVPLEGGGPPKSYLATTANENFLDASPDGRWVAYTSDDTGSVEVYARPFPGPGAAIRVSENGGERPKWSQDGRTLYYRHGESLVAVPVSPGPPFRAGSPRTVLSLPGKQFLYDVGPDDRFLLAIAETTAERSHEVRLVKDALPTP